MARIWPLLLVAVLLLGSCSTTRAKSQAALAEEAIRAGHWERAAALYEDALSLTPNNPQWRYNQLWALLQNKEYEQVITLSEEAAKDFQNYLEFLQIRAKALLEIGRKSEAFELYEEIFEKNPGARELQALVMETALEADESAVAEKLAKSLIGHKEWEKRALVVLQTLYPDSWYELALAYLSRQP
ncbi:MAG: tetratricopeptide repeat protein [Spirochaetales bacterium]|nr:tetratricopeptide repeat protein [Spirochaetales bacterium]